MGELIHFTITTRNRYISNMNRFVIACIFMAFAAAAASEDTYKERNLFTEPPRSAQTDFLETMMHDGEVPEHFFDTPVAAKGNAKKDVAPLYDQESELYGSLVQEEVKAAPLYDQESELYASLLQEAAESKGIRIKDRMKSFKAVLRKNKAFKKVLSNAKNAVANAIKFSKKLLGRDGPSKAPSNKQMIKNALYLKAFATLNADKLYAVAKHMGALGALLQDMSVKPKKDQIPVAKDVIVDLKDKYMAAPSSKADYKRLFRSTCSGDVKKCFPQVDKKGCDAKSHFGCKWVGEWNGRLAVEPMQ